jgi:hypothetical protein
VRAGMTPVHAGVASALRNIGAASAEEGPAHAENVPVLQNIGAAFWNVSPALVREDPVRSGVVPAFAESSPVSEATGLVLTGQRAVGQRMRAVMQEGLAFSKQTFTVHTQNK